MFTASHVHVGKADEKAVSISAETDWLKTMYRTAPSERIKVEKRSPLGKAPSVRNL